MAGGLIAGGGVAYMMVRASAPKAVEAEAVMPADEPATAASSQMRQATADIAQQAGPEATIARMASATTTAARDLDCLTQAVYFEARGETRRGQVAVAQVVLNRVRHPAFPKSVCGVVYQGAGRRGCQFSFACAGAPGVGRESAAWRRARQVAREALAGVVVAEVGAATHFHAVGVSPAWGSRLFRVAQIGMHVFYRFGAPRTQVAVASPPAEAAAVDAVFTTPVGGRPAEPDAAVAPLPAAAVNAKTPLKVESRSALASKPVEDLAAPPAFTTAS